MRMNLRNVCVTSIYCLTVSLLLGCKEPSSPEASSPTQTTTNPIDDPAPPPPAPTISAQFSFGGFDIGFDGIIELNSFHNSTVDRYVRVPAGSSFVMSINRNAQMRDYQGSLDPSGQTELHIGPLTIGPQQFYRSGSVGYVGTGVVTVTGPQTVAVADRPVAIQIWNRHRNFGDSGVSNGLNLWIFPNSSAVPLVPPSVFSNGRIPYGEIMTPPTPHLPALYKSESDRLRLLNAILNLSGGVGSVRGANADLSRGLGAAHWYWSPLGDQALTNAAITWATGSIAHRDRAKAQLKALLSSTLLGWEIADHFRADTAATDDRLGFYGRYLGETFFKALITLCFLGPQMANALSSTELQEINSNLFRFSVLEAYNSLTEDQYYTADGGHNPHWHPIVWTASHIWNLPALRTALDSLTQPTHTECSYYRDGSNLGQYALRYCQTNDPTNLTYESLNANIVLYWIRMAEFFGQSVDVPAVRAYVERVYGFSDFSDNRIDRAWYLLGHSWDPTISLD